MEPWPFSQLLLDTLTQRRTCYATRISHFSGILMTRPHPPYVHSWILTNEVRNLAAWHREGRKEGSLGWSFRWDMIRFMKKCSHRLSGGRGLSRGLTRWHENAYLIPVSWRNKFFRRQGHPSVRWPVAARGLIEAETQASPAKLSSTGTTLICWAVKRVLYIPAFGKQGRFIRNAAFSRASWVLWQNPTHSLICPSVHRCLLCARLCGGC